MGQFVFREGDSSNEKLYVILTGEIGIVTQRKYNDIYAKDTVLYQERKKTKLQTLRVHSTISGNSATSQSDLKSRSDIDEEPTPHQKTTNFGFAGAVRHASNIKKATQNLKDLRKVKIKQQSSNKNINEEEEEKEEEENDDEAEFRKMATRYGELARVLKSGADFGAAGYLFTLFPFSTYYNHYLALTEPGKKRTASVLCKTNCEFLIIDAQTFNEHVKKQDQKKYEFLLKCFTFLSSVTSSQIKNKITCSFAVSHLLHIAAELIIR